MTSTSIFAGPAFRSTLLMFAALAIACPAAAKTSGSISRTEDNLAAAGFLVKPANTPDRVEMLKRLPANKFVQRADGDVVTYVYADPKVCACLYVGTQDAFADYQRAMQDRHLADEEAFASERYQDAQWNWGAWGPWVPRWGFGSLGW